MGQPNYVQEKFRFGEDDGSESAHTWIANEDTNITAGPGQQLTDGNQTFLRFCIANTGSKAGDMLPNIEISYNGGAFAALGSTGAFKYATNATYLTDGNDTTNRIVGTGTHDTSNAGVIENDYIGATNTFTNGTYYNVVVVVQFDQSQAVDNTDYYEFRVTNSATPFDGYTVYPRITIAGLPTATINQTGYRFTSVDGTIASPTWQAASNTNVTMRRGKTIQLWVELEEASGVNMSAQYEIAWQKNGTGGYTTLQGRPYSNAVGSMPAVYGAASDFYANDDAVTSNPVNISAKTFTNGVGVESVTEADVHSSSRTLNNQCTILIFSIHIPSLYGTAASPGTNNKNDYFDFQVRYSTGTALDTTLTARYTLGDSLGHIGGCPAETQGKWGPWQDSNGNLYYCTERSEIDNHMVMMKSVDDGVNWVYQDMDSTSIDLESVDAVQVGDTIHIFHDEGGSVRHIAYYTSDHATLADTFGTSTQVIASKSENDQGCAVGYRTGTADFVVFFRDGTTTEQIYYVIGTPGSWGIAQQLDSTNLNHIGVHVVKGADSDWLHIFYTTEETVPNTIRHRSMNPSTDALTASEVVYSDAYDGGSGWQWAMTPAISWMSGSNDKVGIVIYDDSDNYPYFVSITDDGSPGTPVQIDNVTINNDPGAMTNRSPIGQLFADSSGNLYFMMADATTEDLWIYTSDDDGATWTNQTTPEEIQDGIKCEMVIGQSLTLSGTETLAYVYVQNYGGFDDFVYFDTYDVPTGGRTATASITLGDFTVAATGEVDIEATLAKTLGDFTVDATGEVDTEATASITLDDFTVAATGAVDVDAAASITLDDFTVDATGTVANPAATATADITLDDFTVAATGTVEIEATLAKTLDDFTVAATGTVEIEATLAKTLGDFTVDATGTVTNGPTGQADITLDDFTVSATGEVDIAATAAITVDDFTVSATGEVDIEATASITLGGFGVAAAGAVDVTASASVTLDDFTVDATATVTNGPTGQADITLDDFTVAAVGEVDVAAAAAITLDAFTVAGVGEVDIEAQGAFTLGDFLVDATAEGPGAPRTATADITLGDFLVAAVGAVDIEAAANITIGNFTIAGLADNLVRGQASLTLDGFTASGVAAVLIQAAASITLDNFTVSAAGGPIALTDSGSAVVAHSLLRQLVVQCQLLGYVEIADSLLNLVTVSAEEVS